MGVGEEVWGRIYGLVINVGEVLGVIRKFKLVLELVSIVYGYCWVLKLGKGLVDGIK